MKLVMDATGRVVSTAESESAFATVRLRSDHSRDCGSRETTLAMVFKLPQSAEQRWRRITDFAKLELVANHVHFQDGEQVTDQPDRIAA